ncbi:MAG TPA: hypothetical protein VEV62_04755, partial [Parafilimonas sp.]|nr:hypothetical protein [Parafilimonas sp.]
YHNIKLMVPKNDTLAKPYPVPYDFDFCGLVNAPYAIPDEKADIQNVTQRFYMGFPRTMEELEMILSAFKEKKESIILEIKNFNLLSDKTEKKVLGYLEEFYQVTDNKNSIRAAFINKAL